MKLRSRRFLILGFVGLVIISPWGGVVGATLAGESGDVGSSERATAQSSPELVDVDVSNLPGNGTEADPYKISNVSELQAMEDNLSAHYVVLNVIDASATATANGGKGFDPIGDSFDPFTGSFDGQGHTIQSLVVNRPEESKVGVFGENKGKIQAVEVTGSVNGFNDVGILVGKNSGGTIQNVSATGSVNGSGSDTVGGLVGHNKGTIRNASATGSVNGSRNVGGLVGLNTKNATIRDVSASGSMNGSTHVGGLVGYSSGTIRDASATGSVNGSEFNVGGLVGYNSEGMIRNTLATGSVNGFTDVGGLVGENYGTIRESLATGSVNGSTSGVGGLVGENFEGTIQNVSATGSVNGPGFVGGLVGNNDGLIRNASASGSVNGSEFNVGGLVGYNSETIRESLATGSVNGPGFVGGLVGLNVENGTVRDSYRDKTVTVQARSAGSGTGLRTVQMQGEAARTNMSRLEFGQTWETQSGEYPQLIALFMNNKTPGTPQPLPELVDIDVSNLPGGGTEADPYQVSNVSGLQAMEDDLSAHYVLVSDINASATAIVNGGKGFNPIGGFSDQFIGSFDGQGHTIQNLTIDRPSKARVGLFSENNGTIQHVEVTVSVTGEVSVGGLVGSNEGTIRNASVTGSVTGSNGVGGLVGRNFGTTRNSSASGSVNGSTFVGGLTGVNLGGTIRDASASGSVSGSEFNVGGLVGYNDETIQESLATGSVTGSTDVGGLVGFNSENATIQQSLASGSVTGSADVGGLVGDNVGATVADSFATGSVTGSTQVGGLVGHINGGMIEDSYWDEVTTEQVRSAGSGIGLRTVQMQGEAARTNMSGLEFGQTWEAQSGEYPQLIALSNDNTPTDTPSPTDAPISTPSPTETPASVPEETQQPDDQFLFGMSADEVVGSIGTGVLAGSGLIGIGLFGFLLYQRRSSSTTDSTPGESGSEAETLASPEEVIKRAETSVSEADTARSNGEYQTALRQYETALEAAQTAREQFSSEDDRHSEIDAILTATRGSLSEVQSVIEVRSELTDTLENAEKGLQQAATREANGEVTVPQGRYRQAREQYDQALKTLEEANIEPLEEPLQITRDTDRATLPQDLTSLPSGGDGETLAETGVDSQEAFRAADEETREQLSDLHQMLAAAWWSDQVVTEFATRSEIEARREIASAGFQRI